MKQDSDYTFSAKIYRTGINACVDVPVQITDDLVLTRGRVNIKGDINGFRFIKTLMPVKNAPQRLFVNKAMMLGGATALGEVATFRICQDHCKEIIEYPMPEMLKQSLAAADCLGDFEALSPSRQKAILKYFSFIKTDATRQRNSQKLIDQLHANIKDVRVP